MNLNKKIGFLLDNDFSPKFVSSLNEGKINSLYERLNKKESKEGVEKITKVTTKITPDTAKQGATIPMPAGKTAINIQQKPDGSIEIAEDTEIDQDPYGSYKDTQQLQQRGPSDYGDNPELDKEMDDYDADGMGIMEKFESKAQQGLFWARCNKCKSENCKWCKMAKEFSKSTTKKEYESMPEKKHPEKTVKYKKKETKEAFSFKDYGKKLASVATAQLGKNVNKSLRPTFVEGLTENKIESLIKEYFMPTMSKKELLRLIERQLKNTSLNEDFYFGETNEDFDFMAEPAIKEPATKPKTPTKTPEREKPRRKPSRETPYENPETRPQGKDDELDFELMNFDFMAEPAIKEPTTKPKTPTKTPEREKPRRKPSRETPYENPETRPQGSDEEDEFVMERLFRKVKKTL